MSLFTAILDTLGNNFVSPETVKARLDQCKGCPHNSFDITCTACGCFINWKVQMPSEVCPLGKWQAAPPVK